MFMPLKVLCLIVVMSICEGESGHREKRNVYQFKEMINKVTGRSALDFNGYGCWCGIGGGGPALDGIDRCCKVHDECYDDAADNFCSWYQWIYFVTYDVVYEPDIECYDPQGTCDRKLCECDKAASYCFSANYYHDHLKEVEECEPCTVYGNIEDIKSIGANITTSKMENISLVGVPASNMIVDNDILQLETKRNCCLEMGQKYGVHPALVAALMSRLSRAGKRLTTEGYGEDGKYGLMQCNGNMLYGDQCAIYGPESCEHIEMMVKKKLTPDIIKAAKKYGKDKEKWRKGLWDGITAYEHSFQEFQSWTESERKTNDGDFTNDVVARALRLIHHHKWTCEGTAPSPHLPGNNQTVTLPPKHPNNCKSRAEKGDCEFYTECVEKRIPCGKESYALGYAYRYCKRFSVFYGNFSLQGQEWINSTRICLMKKLLPYLSPQTSCPTLKNVAFDTHADCYVQGASGFCSIVLSDVRHLWDVYEIGRDFFGKESFAAWKQVLGIIIRCAGNVEDYLQEMADPDAFKEVFHRGRQFLMNINRKVNAWEPLLINEPIHNRVNRRKRSAECEQYAQSGDCRFYECFESKFECAEHEGYSHIRDFELMSCIKFRLLSDSNIQVGTWMIRTQQCLMHNLMNFYQQDSLDCEMVELHMLEARASCMVDAGICFLDSTDEWMIERATDRKGYPNITPSEYITLPDSDKTILIDEYYYQTLYWFKMQVGLANVKCYESGTRQNKNLYKYVETARYGTLKIRTEL